MDAQLDPTFRVDVRHVSRPVKMTEVRALMQLFVNEAKFNALEHRNDVLEEDEPEISTVRNTDPVILGQLQRLIDSMTEKGQGHQSQESH